LNEKIGVAIVNGSDREDILKSQFERYHKKDLKEFSAKLLVVKAIRRFPETAKVVLHWPMGILSKSGVATTEAQSMEFKVLAPFKATFTCDRISANKFCNPISRMQLNLGRGVRLKELAGVLLTSTSGDSWRPLELIKNKDDEELITDLTFEGPFPEKKKFILTLPPKLRDDLGRSLVNSKEFPLNVFTDDYSPLVKFQGRFGVLELHAEPMLPVSVRNIEKMIQVKQLEFIGKSLNFSSMEQVKEVIALYEKSMSKEDYPSLGHDARNVELLKNKKAQSFTLPKPRGEHEFETMGIPLKKPGFYVVEIESPRLGASLTASKKPMFVGTSVLVTNMGIHFKKGLESSLVWVTQLDNALPVSEANISIFNCQGIEVASGVTNKEGLLKISKFSKTKKLTYKDCVNGESYYVFAKKGDDFSFMNTNWSQGIETWRYQVNVEGTYERNKWGSFIGHTVMDRTLYRPGEKVQMKHVLREHHQLGFSMANSKIWPKIVLIRHAGSGNVYELPIKIDRHTGTATNTFVLTKEMPLGNYEIYLSQRNTNKQKKKIIENDTEEEGSTQRFDWDAKRTGEFLLSEFRLPLMSGTIKIQGGTLIRAESVKADLSLNYMSGGPAAHLNVKTRAQLSSSYFIPDFFGADEYSFFADPIKSGIVDDIETGEEKSDDIKMNQLVLDHTGGAILEVKNLKISYRPKNLTVEMEYTDPNGEVKTAMGSKLIFPSTKIVGLRIDSWFGSANTTKLLGVVSTPESQLVKDAKYIVEAFKSETYTHRKRLVGGFYAYDSKTEIKSLGVVCTGVTDLDGRFECLPKNLPAGNILLQAHVADDQKAESFAAVSVNVFEKGEDNWWSPGDSDRIDILASKKMVEPHEEATFVVKTPFKEATALITVEREGILDQFVTTVKRDNPVISVPMKESYAPNIFVSAMLVRGRVGGPKPDFLVDLARPAMKMGLAEMKVGWKGHQLKVEITTDQKKYNVKSNAVVKIKVTTPSGAPLSKNTEVILAAVDESLFHLKNNESFNLLAAMMQARGLGVEASSSLNQVIGRRHFGLKAKSIGGGGGLLDGVREHFDPILAFIPNLKVDKSGVVVTTIKLNDSLSSFRIVAIAHSGADLFGTGKVNITTNKDIILYSGISPVARNGDHIINTFTVRNTTEKIMKVQLTVNVTGLEKNLSAIPMMEIKPSETKVISLPITVPLKMKELSFTVNARDVEGTATDSLTVKETLSSAVPDRVLQATLFQLDKSYSIPIKRPVDALTDSGGVKVAASSTLVHGLSGVTSYMEDYPYTCLEQKISKAIVLNDKLGLNEIIHNLPSFIDNDGLLKFFNGPHGCGSSMLTHYVLDILHENKIILPKTIQGQMLDGLKNELVGRTTCQSWWDDKRKDPFLDQKKILILQTLSRFNQFDPKFLESIKLTTDLWENETLIQWANLLTKELSIPKREAYLKKAVMTLRARGNYQGSMMTLESGLAPWRLFSSSDQEVLGLFGLLINRNEMGVDVGKMARGLLARLRFGHWDTTMANAWGMTMMKKFSEKFEKTKVTGQTVMNINGGKSLIDWNKFPKGSKKIFAWPNGPMSKEMDVEFLHEGGGKPWIHVEAMVAIPLKSPMNFGYKISKKITAIDQKVKGKWSVGDVVNVELQVVANNDQSWVVLHDPLPSGASHLGSGMSGESNLLNMAPKIEDNGQSSWPSDYIEKSFTNFITYAGFLPAGTYKTTYRFRLNSAGQFNLPPTSAKAMYSPEVFGEMPNADFMVLP
jgi:hypothetical protein